MWSTAQPLEETLFLTDLFAYGTWMHIQKRYPVGDAYRAIVGWSDRNHGFYYGRIEQLHILDEPYQFRELSGLREFSPMLEFLQTAANELASITNFELPESDLLELQQAPIQAAEPAQPPLYPLNMLDTDYAEMVRRDAVAAQQTLHNTLAFCVDVLEGLRNQCDDDSANFIEGTVEQRVSDILARTAIELVQQTPELFELVDWEQLAVLTSALESDELLSYSNLFGPMQITDIDRYVQNHCRSPLTNFPKAVLARGYDPTSGVPLDCPNPETYDLTALFPYPETETLYELYMSPDEASVTARIQRLDPRDRTESAWTFLEEHAAALHELHSRQGRE